MNPFDVIEAAATAPAAVFNRVLGRAETAYLPRSQDGRPAIFISGAGAGIGRITAELFAERGWFVGLYDIDTAAVEAARAAIGEDRAVAGRLDVTEPDSWTAAMADFWEASGHRLDVLFNNAGIIVSGPLADVPVGAHQKLIDINVGGVINGSHAGHPYLKQTPGSRVINMCSASALYGQPDIATYSASKFAVGGLTEALDLEWRGDGIRAFAIWPLWVKTALAAAASTAKSTTTLGVRLQPSDVAETVWKAAHYDGLMPKPHWSVGLPAAAMSISTKLLPTAITRQLVGHIAAQ